MDCTWKGMQPAKDLQGDLRSLHWCHSIGHIWFPISLPSKVCLYLVPFSRYKHLFAISLRRHVTLTTPIWGTVGHVTVSSSRSQTMQKLKTVALTILKIFYGVKNSKSGDMTLATPFQGRLVVQRLKLDIAYTPFWILLKQTWWGGSGISWTICKLFALHSRR